MQKKKGSRTQAAKPAAPAPRRRAERLSKAARAEQIRTVAMGVLADHGIGHSNHSLIAAAAGVSLPAVFFYYPTHQHLADAVLAEVSRHLQDDVVRHVMQTVSEPLEALDRMLLTFARSIDTHRDLTRVWLDWSTSIRSEVWPGYLQFHREICALVRSVIVQGQASGALRADVDPFEAAHVVVGIAHLVAHMKFADGSDQMIENTIRTLFHNYLAPPVRKPSKGRR